MRVFLLLFILTFTFGCATRNVKYDRNKILKKYSADHKIFVDNQIMDLEIVYLDKDNIENVRIDKETQELKITQLKQTELFELKNLNLDSLSVGRRGWIKNKIGLIVLNGVPLTESIKDAMKIDPNAIKSLSIVSREKLNNSALCLKADGDALFITTKE